MPRKARRGHDAPPPSAFTVSIGECNVSVPPSLTYEKLSGSVSIDVPKHGQITITHASSATKSNKSSDWNVEKIVPLKQIWLGLPRSLEGLTIQLLNPKSPDNDGHLLKAALNLYNTELPEMSFAASTGKESPFLENCVNSGKYCTLLAWHSMEGREKVIAALSYQILPPDTQYAEIPLAAVSKDHQHKGLGSALFSELQRRLQDVGVLTVFCWGDQESEGFWLKQGFHKVAEVDRLGKPRKLPIKPDIRRAMSIPGSAMLLVSHMSKRAVITASDADNKGLVTPPRLFPINPVQGFHESSAPCLEPSPAALITTPIVGEFRAPLKAASVPPAEGRLVRSPAIITLEVDGATSSVAIQTDLQSSSVPSMIVGHMETGKEPMLSLTLAPQPAITAGDGVESSELVMPNQECKFVARDSQSSREMDKENSYAGSYQSGGKRGRLQTTNGCGRARKQKIEQVSAPTHDKHLDPSPIVSHFERPPMRDLSNTVVPDQLPINAHLSETCVEAMKDKKLDEAQFDLQSPIVMFMNMADDSRRKQLTSFVQRLGGRVSNDGSKCTHVITGEARRTLNFCNALNAGAWIVSPAWLKASVKEKRFVEEDGFILQDAVFESKYKTTVRDVILRRRQMSHGLLEGTCIYATKHVQPPVETMSTIVLSAGGQVLASFDEARCRPDAIVVACEDDISEALMAAKEGLPTYSSEWLMSCIMKQELDMTTAQFAESL